MFTANHRILLIYIYGCHTAADIEMQILACSLTLQINVNDDEVVYILGAVPPY